MKSSIKKYAEKSMLGSTTVDNFSFVDREGILRGSRRSSSKHKNECIIRTVSIIHLQYQTAAISISMSRSAAPFTVIRLK